VHTTLRVQFYYELFTGRTARQVCFTSIIFRHISATSFLRIMSSEAEGLDIGRAIAIARDIVANMTLAEMVGQMAQVDISDLVVGEGDEKRRIDSGAFTSMIALYSSKVL